MEKNDLDKLAGELLKKSLQSPADPHFDEALMKMIIASPLPSPARTDKLLKNGWRFLVLALILMISSIGIIAYLSSGDSMVMNELLMATRIYILYGGLALFVPLLFFQLDTLLKMMFQNRLRMDY